MTTKHFGYYTGTGLSCPSFVAEVKSYPVKTQLELTVKEWRPGKSTRQNSYLHVLFGIVARTLNADGMGDGSHYTIERVKAYCKAAGLYPTEDFVTPDGEVVQTVKDTRDLDKGETASTIDSVIRHFAEWGIVLPEPNQQNNMDL